MENKKCKKCGEVKALTTVNFNLLSTGYWRGTCKKCMALNTKRLYDADPSKTIARVNAYKAKIRKAEGSHTTDERDIIRTKQGDRCFYCKKALRGHGEFDHKQPISRGGSNFASNLVLACRTCNRDKRDKTAAEYIAWLGKRLG